MRPQTPGERDLEEQRSNDSPELLRPERRASGLPTWRLPRRRSHLSFCHSLSRSESNSSCSNRLLLMASMDGGARNVLSAVAAAGRALKEVPAATWDARPGADATAPTLEIAAVAVWWRVKLEPGCPSSSSNHKVSSSGKPGSSCPSSGNGGASPRSNPSSSGGSSIGRPRDHVSRTITPACPGITSRGRSPHTAQGPFEHTQPEALLNRNDTNNIIVFHNVFPMAATPAAAVAIAASVGKLPPLRRSHHYGDHSNSTLSHRHPTTETSWQTSIAAEITPFQ